MLLLVPLSTACALPPSTAPAPIGPDGRAHLLTRDSDTVCWWSVDEDGDHEVHRVWPLGGPHAVALVVREDGVVVVVMRKGRVWGVLLVGEAGERAYPVWGSAELVGVRAAGVDVVFEWCDDTGGRLRSRVDTRDGGMVELVRLTRMREDGDVPQSGR